MKQKESHSTAEDFATRVGEKEERKLRAARRKPLSAWHGFLMCGRVGWSVVVPCLLGTALGAVLDAKFPGTYSWTLMLLSLGVGIGCLNAWKWVAEEQETMKKTMNDE